MLLTLAVKDAKPFSDKKTNAVDAMLELPRFVIDELELRGLNIYSSTLSGWSLDQLDALRDRADKAGCPCLVLVEDAPLEFAGSTDRRREKARERVRRIATAASRLGCNSIGVTCEAPDDDESFELAATTIRETLPAIERMELNLLIVPHEGLTEAPDRLTELIKRIGGFRIGALPSFFQASTVGEAPEVLRRTAPYAGAIHASVSDFTKKGKHKGGYDLEACVDAIKAVGFGGTLAIEYIGKGNAVEAIQTARAQLQHAIEKE